jgi:glycosyltransferase involved in cell wall biosynthesis
MKFAIISNLYPPLIRGGAEIIAAQEARGLKNAWQHVFVVTTKPRAIKINKQTVSADNHNFWLDEEDGVAVYRFVPLNIYYYINDFLHAAPWRFIWHIIDTFNIYSYWQVRKILLKEKPDVVITHNLMGLGFLTPLLIRRLGIKHIHTIHDVQLVTPSGLILKGQENNWQHRFFDAMGYSWLMKKLFASPDFIVSPSQYLLDFYSKRGFFPKSKLQVIYNPAPEAPPIKKIASDKLELVYLGQVHEAKGVLELIKLFSTLELAQARLHIIGGGPDIKKASALANKDERIIFHGWLNHAKLWPLLGKMDALVFPSLCYENSPTVIYEALNLGLPVLCADIGGAAELIKDNYNGWKFPAGDNEALKKIINRIYKDRTILANLKDNCISTVAEFTLENYCKKIIALVNEEKK